MAFVITGIERERERERETRMERWNRVTCMAWQTATVVDDDVFCYSWTMSF